MITQIGRLARTTMIYGVGQILLRFISLLLMPLFTSYLTPTEYGISAMLGLISMVVTPIFSLGFGAAIGVCFFEHTDRTERSAVIWTAFLMLCVSVIAVLSSMLVFAPSISELVFQTSEHAYFVQLNAITIAIGILLNPFLYFLQFEERAISYVVITIIVGLISICLSIFFVVYRRQGLEGVLIATVIGQGIGFLLFFGWSLKFLDWSLRLDVGRRLLKLGIPLIPSFFFLFIIMQGNKYLLQSSRGLDELGVFNIGVNMGSVMNLIVGAFTTAWTPFFLSFTSHQEDGRTLFGRLTGYYVLGFGLISLVFYGAARPLVLILTAEPYHGAFLSVGPTATAQLLTGLFSMLLPAMYFAQEVNYLVVVQTGAVLVAIAFGFATIPTFGVIGAALTPVFGMLAMVVAQIAWNYFRRDHYLQIAYPWTQLTIFGIGYVVLAGLLLWDRPLPLIQEMVFSGVVCLLATVLVVVLIPIDDRRVGLSLIWSRIQSLRMRHHPTIDESNLHA